MNEERANFKTGDIVRLKSGGPDMTVIVDDGVIGKVIEQLKEQMNDKKDWVSCQWFDGNMLRKAEFPPEVLERVNTRPKTN